MQILAGLKSYLTAAAMVLYALFGYFYLHSLDANAFAGWLAAAGALVGIRSGVTTEIQKLLAALGVDVIHSPTSPSSIQLNGASKLVAALKALASPPAVKVMAVLLCALIVAPVLSGCQTWEALTGGNGGAAAALCSTPSQCVYQAKGVYGSALAVVVAYGGLPACPTDAPICKDENTLTSIKGTAHTVWDALQAADTIVNTGFLPSGAPATVQDKEAAATSATTEATSFQNQASALPHN